MIIDTHAHLNIEDFDQDLDDVLERARRAGVKRVIVIGMDEASNARALELAQSYDMLYASAGIHPGYIEGQDTSSLERFYSEKSVVAVGECGIDLHWRQDNLEEQKRVFKAQIELAIEHHLPLIIHTRDSFAEAYAVLKPYQGRVTGVFHCFQSTLEDAERAIDLGFLIGIDGPVTYPKSSELERILKAIDLKHILVETDSPFLAPQEKRGKRNEPAYLEHIVERIAHIKSIKPSYVADQTTKNAYQLFQLGGKNT
ncbi:MAG: TatD family hydrolase [Acholeplasmataceae bacterium]